MQLDMEPKRTKPSLGKGLSALLGENISFDGETQLEDHITKLPISAVRAGKYQPRRRFDDEKLESLIRSIREKGIIQPLVVRPVEDGRSDYEIIAGERRWRAARTLGLEEIPVVIRACNDQEALETAIIENVQRDDLSPIEEAEGYLRLMDEFTYTQEQLAKSIGKSRSHVANMLRLNSLPESVKDLVHAGKISAGHARALINKENISELVENIIDKKMNVRDAEKLATKNTMHIPESETDLQSAAIEMQIADILKLKVSLKIKQSGGCLSVFFNSYEEMDELMEKLRSIHHA